MTHRRILWILLLVIAALVIVSCGGTSATPTPEATATPVLSQWQKIMAAYVGPDSDPEAMTLAKSFTEIMELANEIVMDKQYTADEAARAQAIFDAAADAHDALFAGDNDVLASNWKSLDTFMALLRNAETPAP